MESELATLIARQIALPVPPVAEALAQAARAAYPDARVILLYGSALRGGDAPNSLVDLYVLLGSEHDGGGSALSRLARRLLPPNVYYLETAHQGAQRGAKVAVLSLRAFTRAVSSRTRNPYFWARFAQPTRLLHAASEAEKAMVIAALETAHRTLYAHGKALEDDPALRFEAAFRATYATELRAERAGRAASIVASNPDYYRAAAAAMTDVPALAAHWGARRAAGKTLAALRLAKAAFTFAGGADYVVAKIERHSGERIMLTAWQRRHPLIAGVLLLPRLLRRGAVK